jgi:transposase
MALRAATPPRTLAWAGRLCATGFTVITQRASWREPRLNEGQLVEFDRIVETPPDPVADGVVRWRCCDLKAQIAKRFSVLLSERSVDRILNERGFRKLSARPKHPEVNTAAQEAFRQTSPGS